MLRLLLAVDVTNLPGQSVVEKSIEKMTSDAGTLAGLIVGGLLLLGLLHFIFVHIPNQRMSRKVAETNLENNANLAKAVTHLADISADTHLNSKSVRYTVESMQAKLSTLLAVKQQELDAISVVSEKTGVDLSKQLDKASGALNLLQTFETLKEETRKN